MAVLMPFIIPILVLYLLLWGVNRCWPAAAVFICRYRFLFALLCLIAFGNAVYAALGRGQKGIGLGLLTLAVAFAFLPPPEWFRTKKPKK